MNNREKITPSYDYNVGRLSSIYKKAITRIYKILDRTDVTTLSQATNYALMASIQNELIKLRKEAKGWVEENIVIASKDGIAQSLVSLGYAKDYEEALLIARFSQVNSEMVRTAAADTYRNVLAVTENMQDQIQTTIRRISAEVITTGIAMQRNSKVISKELRESIQKMQAKLKESVDVAIVDAAGRHWKVKHYTEMLARTKMMETQITASMNEAIDRGAYYATISINANTKDACRYHQGRIVKLKAEAPGNYPTVDQLKTTGQIFHPNCKHVLLPMRSPDLLDEEERAIAKRQQKTSDAAIKDGGRDPNVEKDKKD
ncbi:minor capsid protein [Bacillus cereus]|uniref:phage minor capsid protein n=1 Tax=Bacillus cereus TaxID=1396 RepID=UPI001F0FD56D|nr:phage minor capsid protein [Bacillus cereus]MCH5476770.1 minor capsid protein [Bacillus cereus]